MLNEVTSEVPTQVVGDSGELPLPWLRSTLDAALAQQQGHALLVHASPGIGALEFALCLAQAWLCESSDASRPHRPCGRCASCRLVQAKSHPDLNLRLPEETAAALGWPVTLDEKRKPSRQIRISEIRGAIDWIVTTAARGRAKVLVLHPAETMNAESASALLKTLEEPPTGARLILTAADPARLLPTVLSRCHVLKLAAPPSTQAQAWLAGQGVVDPSVLLAAAGGRPLEALSWHHEGITAAVWRTIPGSVAHDRAAVFSGWPIVRVLDVLQKLCHDVAVKRAGGSPRFFAADTLPNAGSLGALDAWQRSLQRVMRNADHPWSEALLVESLVAEGCQALSVSLPLSHSVEPAPRSGVPLDTLPR